MFLFCKLFSFLELYIELEQKIYTVHETAGVMSVCATVINSKSSCPADREVFISIATRSNIAGNTIAIVTKHSDNHYYVLIFIKHHLRIMLPCLQ